MLAYRPSGGGVAKIRFPRAQVGAGLVLTRLGLGKGQRARAHVPGSGGP